MTNGKHTFTDLERFAVWEAFDSKCWWCSRPVFLRDLHVDHVIPESALNAPEELRGLLVDLALPVEFDVNSFRNWVPSCGPCNTRKGDKPPLVSRAMVRVFQDSQKRAEDAARVHDRFRKGMTAERALGRLMAALESGILTEDLINDALAGRPVKSVARFDDVEFVVAPPEVTELHVAPGWSVISTDGAVHVVQRGSQVGMTSALERPDPTWRCGFCGALGPWNGVICLSCNQRSDPWD